MMRVQLFSEPEFTAFCKKGTYRQYDESQFYDLLRKKGAFTDKESLALLRHLHGESFITGAWYSRTTAGGSPCLPAISREAMYGLVVIENSRQGIYTPVVEAFSDFEVEARMEASAGGDHANPLVWQAFAQLDIDILLTFRKKDFSFAWEIPIPGEFILENYPLNGVPTQVRVVEEYLGEPELRDGVWCVHNFFYNEKYWWGDDTAEIMEFLRQKFMGLPPLAKGVFTMGEFEAMCWPQEFSDPFRAAPAGDREEDPCDTDLPCHAAAQAWQVVNHMDHLPEEGDSRRHLYLIIETYPDGTFCLSDRISVKYPSYREMLWEAAELASPDREVFLLPVDVNECMGCAKDIRKAVCAFRVAGTIIETFGPEEGLREFEKLLRKTTSSGKPRTNA